MHTCDLQLLNDSILLIKMPIDDMITALHQVLDKLVTRY
jgi:hypothetical protein